MCALHTHSVPSTIKAAKRIMSFELHTLQQLIKQPALLVSVVYALMLQAEASTRTPQLALGTGPDEQREALGASAGSANKVNICVCVSM